MVPMKSQWIYVLTGALFLLTVNLAVIYVIINQPGVPLIIVLSALPIGVLMGTFKFNRRLIDLEKRGAPEDVLQELRQVIGMLPLVGFAPIILIVGQLIQR
jgi:hypothetical protein